MKYCRLRPSGLMKQTPRPPAGWVKEATRRNSRSATTLFGRIRSLARTSKSRTTPLAVAKESSMATTATTNVLDVGAGVVVGCLVGPSVGARVGGLVGCLVRGLVGRLDGFSIVGSSVGNRVGKRVGEREGGRVVMRTLALFSLQTRSCPGRSKQAS